MANRRKVYITSLRQYTERFASKFPNIQNISVKDLEIFLSGILVASSRKTWQDRIRTLLGFARKRGYIFVNPAEQLESISVDRATPVILSVEQSKVLLDRCPPHILPYFVLAIFSGIRPDEIHRMEWADINLETQTAMVNGKTRRRRIVPLEPIAVKLLQICWRETGHVAPSKSTIRRWRKASRVLIGGKWTADILRHTAASYLLAKHRDTGKVSMTLGNSSKILLTHYHNPVSEQEAERFWNLT